MAGVDGPRESSCGVFEEEPELFLVDGSLLSLDIVSEDSKPFSRGWSFLLRSPSKVFASLMDPNGVQKYQGES